MALQAHPDMSQGVVDISIDGVDWSLRIEPDSGHAADVGGLRGRIPAEALKGILPAPEDLDWTEVDNWQTHELHARVPAATVKVLLSAEPGGSRQISADRVERVKRELADLLSGSASA